MIADPRRHHLTDDEFSGLLFGDAPDDHVEQHLASCEHCRAEFEAVGGSLDSLRELGSSWARTKAPITIPIPSQWSLRVASIPAWGTGLAATAAAGLLAFALGSPSSHTPAGPAAAPAVEPPAPRATLADDNQLMFSIDKELSYPVPTPLAGAHSAGHHATHRSAATIVD